MELEPDDAPDLTPVEAQEWQRGRALLVDVRELDEWDAGRIAGSLHLPLSELADRWQELPDADQTVLSAAPAAVLGPLRMPLPRLGAQVARIWPVAARAGCRRVCRLMGGWPEAFGKPPY